MFAIVIEKKEKLITRGNRLFELLKNVKGANIKPS